jgi:hypothetical protein
MAEASEYITVYYSLFYFTSRLIFLKMLLRKRGSNDEEEEGKAKMSLHYLHLSACKMTRWNYEWDNVWNWCQSNVLFSAITACSAGFHGQSRQRGARK